MARPSTRSLRGLTKTPLEDEVLTTDAQVVAALARNARQSHNDLIASTGLPRSSVHNSLLRLREAGMVDWTDGLDGTIHATFGLVVGVPR